MSGGPAGEGDGDGGLCGDGVVVCLDGDIGFTTVCLCGNASKGAPLKALHLIYVNCTLCLLSY